MSEINPADAVREALLPCPFCGEPPQFGAWRGGLAAGHTDATAIECASGLDDCPANPGVTGYTRAEAVAKWNRRPRLAALAGAAPDSPVTIEDLHAASIDLTGGRPSEEVIRELRGHAPAKAREDVAALPAKWRADAERFRALGGDISIAEAAVFVTLANDLDAALATFAEGRE